MIHDPLDAGVPRLRYTPLGMTGHSWDRLFFISGTPPNVTLGSKLSNLVLPMHRFAFLLFVFPLAAVAAVPLAPGDSVRLTRGETLFFKTDKLIDAPNGQEFPLLQLDAVRKVAYVAFTKRDGSVIAATVPNDAVEAAPADGWTELVRGAEAFRDQRYDEAKRLLGRAGQDPQQKALAAAVGARVNGALVAAGNARAGRATFVTMLQGLRETAEGLVKLGHLSLAVSLDEGADKLATAVGGEGLPPSKIDRAALGKSAAISARAVARTRQAVALHKLVEASKEIEEGLQAEPTRPELKAYDAKVKKDLDEAKSRFEQADKMRHFPKGEVHALTAIEHGLKLAADFPQLLALKKEMSSAFEERTSPPVTPEFLAAAKVSTSRAALEQGHKLYTTRCTECHDLELLDSRGASGWQRTVAGMSRRANLTDAEQQRILDYIAAAQISVEALASK